MNNCVPFFRGRLWASPFAFLALGTLYYIEGLVPFVIIFLSAALHEMGHIIAVYKYKSRVLRFYVYPMGCVISYDGERLGYREQRNISLAGGITNILFFAVGGIVFWLFPCVETLLFVVANLFFCLFNMIPIKGNDGSNCLYFSLAQRNSPEKSAKITKTAEIISSAALVCVGVWVYSVSGASPVVLALIVFAVMK